ncbi:MAG TPA: hypothetical protein VL860_14660 [Planctomycetota bacterium]|nr:hypothetical protein [Planctomycetota bacterium]
MTPRQFHLVLLVFLLATAGVMVFIDHPADVAVPPRFQAKYIVPATYVPPSPPAPSWLTPPATAAGTGVGAVDRPLLNQWRTFPVHACIFIENGRIFDNHFTLGPCGRVRERLSPADRAKLWQLFCRLGRQSADDLDQFGLDALITQSEQADSIAWLATTRGAFELDAGADLTADWAKKENSPRGALVWWVAMAFPADPHNPATRVAPSGAFQAVGDTDWPHAEGTPPLTLYSTHAGTVQLYAVPVDRLLLIGPSREVLRRAILRRAGNTVETPVGGVEDTGFHQFRANLAAAPDAEFHAFAEGDLLALALEQGHIPDFYVQLAQVRKFDRLLIDGCFRRQVVDITASVEVPQRSVYDFIALDGPRQMDRFLPADLLGYASLRLNLPGLLTYAVTLASQGYFGSKAQQAALLAGPLLAMSNLPSALGNEMAAALSPSQDKTYLAWSFALPWRAPHKLSEIVSLGGLAGTPFDGPSEYRGESIITPKFKAKMEFRYPVVIQVPDAYDPPRAPAAAPMAVVPAPGPAPAEPPVPAGPTAAPARDSVLLIAANGWNLPDVLDVKQGKHPNLAAAKDFQRNMQEHAGDSAVQVYLNLSHGFGYAYVTLLGELYGLPIGGEPLEEDRLPRSEAFGPMGHMWISLSRAKLPPPPSAPDAPAPNVDPMSRLKFHLVWKME